jgi:mannitol/fructose-specific phosphotransferase system IIA component
MLKPIATPHPMIVAGSLILLAGMIIYMLRSGLEKPDTSIAILVAIAVSGVCGWSQSRRSKEIAKKYSKR